MKRLINRLTTLTAFLAIAGLVSCSKSPTSEEPQPNGIRLELTASLNEGFGAASSDANGGTTKAPVFGSNFPAGTHLLSLAVFKSNETEVWGEGYENIKAEVTVSSYGAQSWRFQMAGTSTWKGYLSFPESTAGVMWITAIYPYNESMTISSGASLKYNFDLTTTEQQASQSDIMIAKPAELTIASGDRSKALLLSFTHMFSLFEFQIAPIFNDPCKITKIALVNGNSAENWVSNKGSIDSNGNYVATNHGEVAISSTLAMTMGAYNTYQIMIPISALPFGSYTDGDITVRFTDATSTIVEPLPLAIKREWLMPSGLQSGNRYSFKLIYHNAATSSGGMTVTDWAINEPIDEFWGVPPINEGYLYFDNSAIITSGTFSSTAVAIANPTTTSYNDHNNDGVNNGGLLANITSAIGELPYYRFEVAAANEVASTWADAWAACKAKAPAAKWRLPRTTELMLIQLNQTVLATTPGFTAIDNALYWAGTEQSDLNAWTLHMSLRTCSGSDKSTAVKVRCVREL